jgi:hypothetical protein
MRGQKAKKKGRTLVRPLKTPGVRFGSVSADTHRFAIRETRASRFRYIDLLTAGTSQVPVLPHFPLAPRGCHAPTHQKPGECSQSLEVAGAGFEPATSRL